MSCNYVSYYLHLFFCVCVNMELTKNELYHKDQFIVFLRECFHGADRRRGQGSKKNPKKSLKFETSLIDPARRTSHTQLRFENKSAI
jgi:hypothetical protein